jgi:hypothetical protein
MDEKIRVFTTRREKQGMEFKPGWLVAMVASCRKQDRAAQLSGGTARGIRVIPIESRLQTKGCLMIGKEVKKE